MKHFAFALTLFLTFFSLRVQGQLSVSGYSNYAFSGFNVLVEDNAFAMDSVMTNDAIQLMQANLAEISQFNIDPVKMDSLKAVPIFMDWNTTTGAAQYHPSQAWLIANGYIPEKAKCVEISNITNFFNWTNQNQPYMVMHELSHAYHHRVLNFNSSIITNAFNHAVATNLYTNVSYHAGGGNYTTQALAYALNNDKEYFAEISEAYFGLNDYFPFDYNDLSSYDPVGFDAAVAVWGDITVSIPAIRSIESTVYPNPSAGIVTLEIEDPLIQSLRYEVLDLSGRVILSSMLNQGSSSIVLDIAGEPDGMYLLRLVQDSQTKVFKVIKR